MMRLVVLNLDLVLCVARLGEFVGGQTHWTPSCVVVATSASTRVRSKMHSAAPYSSTGSAKSATAPMRTSATAPAV